jgi:hypothetical protein
MEEFVLDLGWLRDDYDKGTKDISGFRRNEKMDAM